MYQVPADYLPTNQEQRSADGPELLAFVCGIKQLRCFVLSEWH